MGIQNRFADCRTAQEGDGSVTVTIPRPLAEEWEIEQGDQILFFAKEGTRVAQIRPPNA